MLFRSRGQTDEAQLRKLLDDHIRWTGSRRARELLDNWSSNLQKFVKVFPLEYKRALADLARERESKAKEVRRQAAKKEAVPSK